MAPTLITGATGFIGSQVALRTLQAGHRVRLTIRREEQADKLRRIFAEYEKQLEFVIVPDITVPGCFDEALQGVEYVLHLASPLPNPGSDDLVTPAKRGTMTILESAAKVPSIKKVVVTGSVLSLISLGDLKDGLVVREDNEINYTLPPDSTIPTLPPMAQYHASKLAAHKATLDFHAANHPQFDIVTLHPVFVYGRSLVQETPEQLGGSCGALFQSLFAETPSFQQLVGVHIDDVADAHVRVLDGGVSGLRSYLLASETRSWGDVRRFLEGRYPGVGFGLKDTEGTEGTRYRVDAGRAERELGVEFKGMEDMVGDVVDQQFELKGGL
ncbi:reductase [Aspergillus bombycis]|uniref:Reductase n=1 Tax=Aspergillus bombycis TaxID=109264 RepID=A0A1F8AI10_9EURO|nr:reductase [Aspergillus bombycis]OGM51356.1 reductase [Aspergillus bombycis]